MSKIDFRRPSRFLRLVIVFLLVLAMAAYLVWQEFGQRRYWTVSEVLFLAPILDGQTIRVRGWATFGSGQTLIACDPHTCDCNTSWGALYLTAHQGASLTLNGNGLAVFGHQCRGNECSMVCPLFNPTAAEAFEFEGILMRGEKGFPESFYLDNVNLATSFQLNGRGSLRNLVASPIPQGQFTIPITRNSP
jgi:hypothetical protein